VRDKDMNMKRITLIVGLATISIYDCAPSQQTIQTGIEITQSAWTLVPSQTAQIETQIVTQIATRVVVQTPTPTNSKCVPITKVNYSDNNTVIVQNQAYVSRMS
jgi:hypothetical protein